MSQAWWAPRVVPEGRAQRAAHHDGRCRLRRAGHVGGVVPTPALDRIANAGLRYTNFHSTSLCSPTRAALITGRNTSRGRFGVVGEAATGFPGYDSIILREVNGTIGTILKENGYATSWFGKDHNTPFLSGDPGRPLRPVPNGIGLRVLLWLRRRRHQPVGAEPVPQYDGHLTPSRANQAGT